MLWGQWITCSQMWKIKLKDNIDVACRLDCYTDKTEFCHGSRSKDGDWGNTDWTEYSLSGQVRYGTVATALRGTKPCQKASYLLALCCLFLRLLARRSQINFLLTLRPLLQSCSVPSQDYTPNPYRAYSWYASQGICYTEKFSLALSFASQFTVQCSVKLSGALDLWAGREKGSSLEGWPRSWEPSRDFTHCRLTGARQESRPNYFPGKKNILRRNIPRLLSLFSAVLHYNVTCN